MNKVYGEALMQIRYTLHVIGREWLYPFRKGTEASSAATINKKSLFIAFPLDIKCSGNLRLPQWRLEIAATIYKKSLFKILYI